MPAPAAHAATTPAAAPAMRVLGVASEMFPLIKTGGLADVAGALPAAMAGHGVEMATLLPGYPAVMAATDGAAEVAHWAGYYGGPARVLRSSLLGPPLLVLDAPHLYARPGNPYLGPDGHDWPDNGARYAALALAAARIAWGEGGAFVPQVLHLHDWQAALAPAFLRYLGHGRRAPATVLTLHNLAFQGQFPASTLPRLGLPESAFTPQGVEYHGDVGFLKAGLQLADALTTVSPTYAQEICTPEGGMGFDAMLRWRGDALQGIVNGIDTQVWDPSDDAHLARRYTLRNPVVRRENRAAVEARFGLPADAAPLICMISRLTTQKGIDLVVEGLDAIVEAGARLVVLGSGDKALEAALSAAAARHPTRVALRLGYHEGLSHLMQGGCDAILVPSRFEPCGLTQLCGLRYGCVPVVSRVGGLADTVIDANDAAVKAGVATGVQFGDVTVPGLLQAVRRTVALYHQGPVWRAIQRAGMHADVGWGSSAAAYAALYRSLMR